MWDVVQTNTFFCTLSREEFVDDFGFETPLEIMKQNAVDIPRMKTYILGKRVQTVDELDRMLRFYNFSFAETLLISQLCTQTSLAYAYERALELLDTSGTQQHLGGSGGRHAVHIWCDRVTITKVFRVFRTDDDEFEKKCTVRIDTNLLDPDVSITIALD